MNTLQEHHVSQLRRLGVSVMVGARAEALVNVCEDIRVLANDGHGFIVATTPAGGVCSVHYERSAV